MIEGSRKKFRFFQPDGKLHIPGIHREPPLPPGFIPGTEKNTYMIDRGYIDAHQTTREMPVNHEYPILTKIKLLGGPRVIIHDEMARSPQNQTLPKDKWLPTLTEMTDLGFYRQHFMPQAISEQTKGQPEKQWGGRVVSPIEVRPFATNVFIYPALDVQYAYGIQPVGDSDTFNTSETSPRAVHNGKINVGQAANTELKGLAYVGHMRIPVDFREYFKSPDDIHRFNGELPLNEGNNGSRADETKTQRIFHELFKSPLEDIGDQVSAIRHKEVKGILLSPVKTHYRLADGLFTVSPNPEGEMVMAATYLI